MFIVSWFEFWYSVWTENLEIVIAHDNFLCHWHLNRWLSQLAVCFIFFFSPNIFFSVCEVLPLICAKEGMQLSGKQYSKWLQKAMEFYVVYISQPNKRPASPSGSGDIKPQGLQDKDGMLANPWKSLHHLLILISERCDWDTKCIPSHEWLVYAMLVSQKKWAQKKTDKYGAIHQSA